MFQSQVSDKYTHCWLNLSNQLMAFWHHQTHVFYVNVVYCFMLI